MCVWWFCMCSQCCCFVFYFFFSSRRRHTRCLSDWSSDVCSSDLYIDLLPATAEAPAAVAGGVDHVCLSIRCDDLGKAAEALRRRGVTLEGEVDRKSVV